MPGPMQEKFRERTTDRLCPMQEKLKRIVSDRCESAVLELQKFPELPGDGRRPQYDQLATFCRKIDAGKDRLPQGHCLPAPPEGMGREFILRSGGRLLVDHSGGLIENSHLCLHRLFGYPQIPGSALKGVARAYADQNARDREQFSRIFGGEMKGKSDKQGKIAFLPAVPADRKWHLVVDVLTPHGGVDDRNPVPVFFPALERGVLFRFQVRKTERSVSDADLEAAADFLRGALTENGVGAKTGVGYGWFEAPQDGGECSTGADLDQLQAAEVEKWGMTELQDHLEECFALSPAAQKRFVQRMIQEKAPQIRRWRKKNNPNLARLEELAKSCGEVLPE